jgi:hypothetical protein
MDKKGQSGGLVTGLVFGIASLIIGIIVAFVLVSTLTGAGLLPQDSVTTLNEAAGIVNNTGYTLAGTSYAGATGYSLTAASNGSTQLTLTNFTVSSTGVVRNASAQVYELVVFNYTYSKDSKETITTDALSANFSKGVSNISSKIPTILLVAAIVLIIGVLAVLVGVWQRMKMGGGQL